jgi:hypothetical protein
MIRDNSRREAPSVSSDLIRRSSETDGSPASILAIRDWLDWSRLASSACVRFRRRRHSRNPSASRTLSSTYAASSAVIRRNSWAVPTFQPLASRRVASPHARSYPLNLRMHASITGFGVARVVLRKTARITTASASARYTILQSASASADAFRDMKSPLMERPIFHHLKDRVQTRIFLCVLAYHLLVAIEKRFLDQGIHTSWATLREQLSTHQVQTIVLPATNGQTLRIRKASTPETVHREIYRTLRISHEVMKPGTDVGPDRVTIVTLNNRVTD